MICLLDSFECNHTEAAKECDVYRLQTHVIICPWLYEWIMVLIWIHHGTHSYMDITHDHSTVHSTAGVCVVCVTLQLCVYLTKESSVTESNYGRTRERIQVARQDNQM